MPRCFSLSPHTSGPLFNMLVSLATGFYGLLIAADPSGSSRDDGGTSHQGDVTIEGGVAHVQLSADVALGCCFLVVYNGVILVLGLRTGSLPKRFYVFARAWYCLYFVLACLLGFHVLDDFLPASFRT